ncbi:hypothetical protein [Robertkochia flava]|uniref:hypothetical protein n=1 Tax=Robertkochia flava TaxID=3447986 RepID=UPI001CCA3F10|nr:hypothetical protein [Robertkochia marina]
MKTTGKILSFVFAIGILSISVVSCSKSSVADEDSLYEQHEGVDRYKVQVPENG